MVNNTDWLTIIISMLPGVVVSLAVLLVLWLAAWAAFRLLNMRRLLRQEWVYLELTPPAQTEKSPEATQQLFAVLHGLDGARSYKDTLLRRKEVFSLEVVSTRERGIRYLMRVSVREAPIFEQAIASYLPEVRYKRVEEYLPSSFAAGTLRVLDFKQTGHFAYPLQKQWSLIEHDPIAYLTGTMTQLAANEMVVFQIVATPTRVREAEAIAGRILNNEELLHRLGKRRTPGVGGLFRAVNSALFAILESIGDLSHSSTGPVMQANTRDAQREHDVAMKIKPARTLSAIEQQMAEAVHEKVSQPLFRAKIRTLIITPDAQSRAQRLKGIRASLTSLSLPKYQSLKARYDFPPFIKSRLNIFTFFNRLPSLLPSRSVLLSASEIANVYHFPFSLTAKTENVVRSLSRTLPAPISLKGKADFDVVLGRNHHHGAATDIGLTAAERERHVYVLGGTGNGKTTMLEYSIVQDIKNGKGVAVVDPHGDLAEKLLRYIPEDRVKDVIYFNPADLKFPIGLNLLELPEGLSGDELIDAKDFITEAIISIMRKIFSDDDTGGHRIEYVLRNTVQTALTVKDATLFTVFDLLTDSKYRKKIVKTLEDEKLKNFWKEEVGKAGDMQRVKMAAGVTAKIGRFQFSASAERILSQPKSTINFEEILDGKILICNFAKGLIGEDTSELFGISTLAKLQLAAYRRVKQKRTDRKPFYLYVDEFQNFATMSFVQMLSEARKYRVFLTMAEQSTSQQNDQRMVNTILANVGTVICFRSGNPADEQLILPLFSPYIQEGEIANLATYNFYARISAVLSQEPVSGETLLLEDSGSETVAQSAITASRANYARQYKPTVNVVNAKPITTKQKTKKPIAANQTTALPGD